MNSIAFVGCAHIHTPGFIDLINKRGDIKVKTVWDDDPARGKQRAEQLGAAFTSELADVTGDPEVIAAVVCSTTKQHETLVPPLAQAGKHLFVEKPLGFAGADAFQMASEIEKAGVLFQTGYFSRGMPALRFLKQQVEAGAFGKITRVRASNCHSGALGGWFDGEWRWMADLNEAGVGAFGDLGTHALDILLWIFGEVELATGLLSPGTARYGDCDETGEALLQFKSGVIGTLAAAWDDVANPVSYLISGTEGHATIIEGKLYFQSSKAEGADGKEPWTDLPEAVPAGLNSFIDAVNGKEAELVTAREAALRSSTMEAIYRGAASRSWVLPEVLKP